MKAPQLPLPIPRPPVSDDDLAKAWARVPGRGGLSLDKALADPAARHCLQLLALAISRKGSAS